MHTETSQSGGQSSWGGGPSCRGCDSGRQAGWGCIWHIAHHSRGAWAEIYQVVFCSLTEDLDEGEMMKQFQVKNQRIYDFSYMRSKIIFWGGRLLKAGLFST